MPIPIIIEGETFYEGYDITPKQVYAAMKAGKRITTSQPSPQSLTDMWDGLLGKGYDSVIHVPIASELSSSFRTAKAMAENYGGKVLVADNHRISVPLREALRSAVRMAQKGMDAKDIVQNLEKNGDNYSVYITVDTLEYLQKSGRISAFTAQVGKLFGIKPVLSIRKGLISFFSKQRGMKKSKKVMFKSLADDAEKFSSLDYNKMTLAVAGTAVDEEEAAEIQNTLAEMFPGRPVYYNELPACVGCHTGEGAVGLGFCFDD